LWLLALVALAAGMQAPSSTTPLYQAEFMVAQEAPYNNGTGGIQFFALQRIGVTTIDQATCSIDADLPLAQALRDAKGQRVRVTIELVRPPALQRLVR
jgi:hypothetical protein